MLIELTDEANKGTVLEFPDGMNMEAVENEIRKEYYPDTLPPPMEEPTAVEKYVKQPYEPVIEAAEKVPGFLKNIMGPVRGAIDSTVETAMDLGKRAYDHLTRPAEEIEMMPSWYKARFERGKTPWIKSIPEETFLGHPIYRKGTEALVDYMQKDQPYWNPESEMKFAREHPNLAAARYALIKAITFESDSLIPGLTWLLSPSDWESFKKRSTEEQTLELQGLVASWMVTIPGFYGAGKLARFGLSKIPWLEEIMTTPIGGFLRKSNWFRRMTNKERGLVTQSTAEMKAKGFSDAEILKGLRDRPGDYQRYFDELVEARRVKAEPPPVEKPTPRSVEVKPIVEKPPEKPISPLVSKKKVEPIAEVTEEVKAETVRLYRGEERIKTEIDEETGMSFTPDIEYAKRYQGKGKLYYIDVPKKILAESEFEGIRRTDSYTGEVHEIELSQVMQKEFGGKKILEPPAKVKPTEIEEYAKEAQKVIEKIEVTKETGEIVILTRDARKGLEVISKDIERYNRLLECLKS